MKYSWMPAFFAVVLLQVSALQAHAAWWDFFSSHQKQVPMPGSAVKVSPEIIEMMMKSPFCLDPDAKYDQSMQYHPADRLEKATTTWSEKLPDGSVVVKGGVDGTDYCKGDYLHEFHCIDYNFTDPNQTRFTTLECSDYGNEICKDGACVPVDEEGNPIGGERGREGRGGETTSCGGSCKANQECVEGVCKNTSIDCSGTCGTPGCPECDIETGNCIFIDGKDKDNDIYIPGTIQFQQKNGNLTITESDACMDNVWLNEYGCTPNGEKLQNKFECPKGCNKATGACFKGECIDEDAGATSKTWGNDLVGTFSIDFKYATPSKAYIQDSSGAELNTKTDYCVDAEGKPVEKGVGVVESYCKDGNIPIFEGNESGGAPISYTCPKELTIDLLVTSKTIKIFDGCCKGACYVENLYCSDSDDGVDLKTAGVVIKGNGCGVPPDVKGDVCGVARYKAQGPGLDFTISGEYGDSVLEYTCDNGEIEESWHLCQGKNNGCHKGACVDLSDKICQSEILKSGNPDLADVWGMVENGKVAKGFFVGSGGIVEEVTKYQSCNEITDIRTTYSCADEIQTGQPGNFAKPWFYVVATNKKCSMGCPAKPDVCPECVEDIQEWPNPYKNNMCGVW